MKFNKGDLVRIKRDRISSYPYVDLWDDIGIVVWSTLECTEVLFKNHDNLITKNRTYDIATTALETVPITVTESTKYWDTDTVNGYALKRAMTRDVKYEKYELNKKYGYPFSIKDVIFNDPAVIVLWNDGSKTVVKCSENDIFDPEKGLAMAISKKALGNQGNYYETFKKYLPEEENIDDFVTSEPTKQTVAYDEPYYCATCKYLCQPLESTPCYGCKFVPTNSESNNKKGDSK